MMRFITTLLLSTVLVLAVKGQNYTSKPEKTGFWTTGPTWIGGTMPGTLSAGTITLNARIIVIDGTVKSLDDITTSLSNISVNAGDTLIIHGSLTLAGSLFTNDGVLIVYGNVSNAVSGVNVSGSGKMVVTGNYNSSVLNGNTFNGPTYVYGSTTNLTTSLPKEADLRTKDKGLYNYVNYMGKALPIELAYFKATLQHNQVELKWETLTEINNDYFIVERSSDGNHFYEVKRVKGAGNSRDRLEYMILDRNPLPGRSYYKLSQVDFDGQKEGFKVVTVLNDRNPIPTTDILYFNCSDCNYSVTLKDSKGFRLDGVQVTEIEQGKFGIDLTQLNPGAYSVSVTVRVSETGPPSTFRIVKK